jgi:hypothetical protein
MADAVQPLIVIGMHRSGTSLVSRMLERLGVHMGRAQEHNAEALFFLRANEWILSQCGAAWDHPEPLAYMLDNPPLRQLAAQYLRDMLSAPNSAQFVGVADRLRGRTPLTMTRPWGWKDPRNTFTLGLWLEIFPQARVIHVLRHGVDVAASLRTRLRSDIERSQTQLARRRMLRCVLKPFKARLVNTARCATLEGGFGLWRQYLSQGRAAVESCGERGIEIRFEDLLADPAAGVDRLCNFAGLSADEATRSAAAGMAKSQRACAWRGDAELGAFAHKVREELAQFGYEADGETQP